jgi:phosphate transport system protein
MLRTHYVGELEAVRTNFVQMGETTLALLAESLKAVGELSQTSSTRAGEIEAQIDNQYRTIHDQCLKLITLQAPVAGDARLLTGILDAILDLESIGDHAYEMATLGASIVQKPPTGILVQIMDVGGKIRDVLSTAIDSWRKADRAQALSVRPSESIIHSECESLYERIFQLVSTPGEGAALVDLMLVCKHLERILRHAIYVADQAAEAAPLAQAG